MSSFSQHGKPNTREQIVIDFGGHFIYGGHFVKVGNKCNRVKGHTKIQANDVIKN